MNASTDADYLTVLRKRFATFEKHLARVQHDVSTEEIHDFRVACRELLACEPLLRTLGPTRGWRKRVRTLLKSLNTIRDLQQMHEHLAPTHSAPMHSLENAIATRTAQWQLELPARLNTRLARKLHATRECLQAAHPAAILDASWQTAWQMALSRTRHQWARVDATRPRSLHRLRVRFKRLRYLAELRRQASAFPAADAATLKHWQSALGAIQDYTVMRHWAEKLDYPPDVCRALATEHDRLCQAFLMQQSAFSDLLDTLSGTSGAAA